MADSSNKSPCFEKVLESYLNRRAFIRSGAAAAVAAVSGCAKDGAALEGASLTKTKAEAKKSGTTPGVGSSLSFNELAHGLDKNFAVAEGYDHQVLISWGDALFADAPEFDAQRQSEASQLQQFGYNNDFIAFVPLPYGSKRSDRGLLVVNHEYTSPSMMFPGSPSAADVSLEQAQIEIAAHGLSIIEIKKQAGQWHVDKTSSYNRRITPQTPMIISGAASASSRLQTLISKDGIHTLGTYGNCAGGLTPWGTILTAEENVDAYFHGDIKHQPEAENYQRFVSRTGVKAWANYFPRWNLDKNPNELLHVGWVVEIDPYDPGSKPKKRTSLGRFKHEGCNVYINADKHVVAYSGDDQAFEYIYKFVSKNKYDEHNRQANLDLLDEGSLYVARFDASGKLHWLPLTYGQGPLTEKNGFSSQADVLIDARKAGDLVGATPMDRPEDVDVNPVNGRVYAMLTNNSRRKHDQLDAANPRAHNANGQIIEFWPEGGDHTKTEFNWDLMLLAGKPGEVATSYHADISENGWLSCPDNCAFDQLGNLWIATDGAEKSGIADGVWATEVNGPNRALTKRFLRTPIGAELCGPFFTPDDENFFVSVQHPGGGSSFDKPTTRWPDFDSAVPPRPSVLVITKQGGGRVGS
ncbi:PhoX family protein [Agaribacterium haliotis]|uniref:PhoX family protein n=1 Tax=Agaribacterium haliotis TaxID=2013869 RepID=UPI000BB59C37|nr:PhoX family phosphatase [Agaribacterium haliotis]